MVRPLRGQQEVFRRLNERNEARRVRTNEVRELGGLEPLSFAHKARQMEEELRNYLNSYVGAPNVAFYQRALFEGLQPGTVNLIAASSRAGHIRTADYARATDYARRATDDNLRGQSAQYMYIDTEAGLPSGRFDEMYGRIDSTDRIDQYASDDWWDKIGVLSPEWAWMAGKMTYEEYKRQTKVNDLKKEKKVTNSKAKFVLEKEY